MAYYQYFKRENITPFIDLNGKGGRPPVYKNDFTIDTDGVPICPAGQRMHRDGGEAAKGSNEIQMPGKCTEKMVVFPVPVKHLVQMQNTEEPFT